MTEQSEKILISLAKRGDMAAFEQLVLAHEKRVYNIALRMAGSSEDANFAGSLFEGFPEYPQF